MTTTHFEDIWNEAEALAAKENRPTEAVIASLHQRIDMVKAGLTLDGRSHAVNLGEILFDLCDIAQRVGRKDDPCNVAAGLRLAIENHKAEMYDPEEK
jgi:hypothetical protein